MALTEPLNTGHPPWTQAVPNPDPTKIAADVGPDNSQIENTTAAAPSLLMGAPPPERQVPLSVSAKEGKAKGLDNYCVYRSAVGAVTPQPSAGAGIIYQTTEHEEVARQAVQVFQRFRVDLLAPSKLANQALGPPDDRAGEVKIGRGRRPARQD